MEGLRRAYLGLEPVGVDEVLREGVVVAREDHARLQQDLADDRLVVPEHGS